jgi:hypothetical protein
MGDRIVQATGKELTTAAVSGDDVRQRAKQRGGGRVHLPPNVARRFIAPTGLGFAAWRQKRYLLPRARLAADTRLGKGLPAADDYARIGQPPASSGGFNALYEQKGSPASPPTMSPATAAPSRVGLGDFTPSTQEGVSSQQIVSDTTPKSALRTLGVPAPEILQADSDLAEASKGMAMPLDPGTRELLAQVIDIRIPAVQLYVNQAADALARRHRADAISSGDKIFFRAGKYAPHTPVGLALLAHELTHAGQARLEAASRPMVSSTQAQERLELAALQNEQRVLRYSPASVDPMQELGAWPTTPSALVPSPQIPPREAPAPVRAPVLAADSERFIGSQPGAGMAPLLTEQQLRQVKEVVYHDFLERIRTEFERGA